MRLQGFYFITDSKISDKNILETVGKALEGGASVVQYREKEKPIRELLTEAAEVRRICAGKASFLVNDRIDIALAVDADGVHLGQDDMPIHLARKLLGEKKIIGITVHNVSEALEAETRGADYLGVSPIYATGTKADAGEPAGVKLIREVRENTGLPIAAIGGITKENIDPVVEAGADMVCAISATICAEDIADAVEYFAKKTGSKTKK
ncbi:MAG TPA: thiamine phosphate synthase [Candidatus Altiarchaeales archaeon]|nr:thiamine phosphate synthase [Candidatus Altiarchaeales archaeon]